MNDKDPLQGQESLTPSDWVEYTANPEADGDFRSQESPTSDDWARLFPLFQAIARKEGIRDSHVEDAAQDGSALVCELVSKRKYNSSLGSFIGWACGVMRMHCKNLKRSYAQLPINLDATIEAVDQSRPVGEDDLDRELMQKAIRMLSAADQDLAKRVYFDDQPYHTIADELGSTVTAIAKRVERMKARLRGHCAGDDADGGPTPS